MGEQGHVLAQANVARMRFAPDDARMTDFVAALDRVNAEADAARGFLWRLQTDAGHSMDVRAFDDPRMLFNLSVWESLEDLFRYTYRSMHADFFRRRREWFETAERPSVVMWWIQPDHRPSVAEALDRLDALWTSGPSPEAFDFRTPFDSGGGALDAEWRRRVAVPDPATP